MPCRLLKAAASALQPGSTEFIETVQAIRQDHLDTVKQHISDSDILKRVQEELNEDCDRLMAFLRAIQVRPSRKKKNRCKLSEKDTALTVCLTCPN